MEKVPCSSCNKPKALLNCGICQTPLCKNCAKFLEEEDFSFLVKKPEHLQHGIYCEPCYDEKVVPEIAHYAQTMALAKEVTVFYKTQKKETRIIKRLADPVFVEACPDREETLLRLAFQAVQAEYDGIIDVDITSKKVKNGTYTNLTWKGTGIPAHINPNRLNR